MLLNEVPPSPAMGGTADPSCLDARLFMELAAACVRCRSYQDFREIVRTKLGALIPHGMLVAAIGRLEMDHIYVTKVWGVNIPDKMLAELTPSMNLRDRPVVAHWLRLKRPVILELPRDTAILSTRELHEIQSFGLGRLAIHGVIDTLSRGASYFSFAQVSEDISENSLDWTLRLIVPLLHQALLLDSDSTQDGGYTDLLTPSELEVLRWAVAGRTNSEIAKMRGRAVHTIRNQLHTAFSKLGVASRTEASMVMLSRARASRPSAF